MAYERIDWENEPSVNTPINEDNLNHMEDGIVQNETDIAGKMNANNPTGTGSFSLNRKSGTTIGNHSFAEGWDTEASGSDSHAEGGYTKALGSDSHAEGQGTEASSFGTHAEGLFTEASGPASHAEGLDTKALANASHAQNRGTIAASENQTAMGRFNIADNHAEYARIVGNGTDNNNRSNAETLDWDGNLTIAGDYTNGNGETLHGAYQAFIDGLPVDSASGNPCVITDAFNTNAKSVKLTLNPIQDLHGYDKPWVGGSGKNKLKFFTETKTSSAGTVVTPQSNGRYNWSGSNTSNAHIIAYPLDDYQLSGQYRFVIDNYSQVVQSDGNVSIYYDDNGTTKAIVPNQVIELSNNLVSIAFYAGAGKTFNYTNLGLMFIAENESTSFAPYENICPISGRTGSNLYRYGKNLLNASGIVRKNTKRLSVGLNLKVNAGDSFVFSSDYAGLQFAVGIHSASVGGSEIEDSGWLNANASYTFTHDGYMQGSDIGIRKSNDSTISDTEMANIKNAHTQLERSLATTDYEPFDAQTITVQLGQTVYGGVLDVTSGVLTINKVGVDMGGLEWTYQNTAGRFYIDLADLLPPTSDSIAFSGSASNCKVVASNRRDVETDPVLFVFAGQNRVYSKNFADTSVEAFQTTMNGQILCYELATPTIVQLTAEEVTLLHGDNVLTTDADNIDVEYSADIALYIAKKIAEGVNSTRSLSKSGSSESTEEVKKEETPKEETSKEEVKEETKEEVKEEPTQEK